MRTGRNLLAGVLGSLLTTLVGLAVIPFYLSHLGIEAYGVIGFFVTAQALLQLLDMGVAPTVNREIARLTASNAIPEARKLLRTLEVINWSAATLIAVVILALAELVSAHWLQSQTLTSSTSDRSSAARSGERSRGGDDNCWKSWRRGRPNLRLASIGGVLPVANRHGAYLHARYARNGMEAPWP